MKKRYVGLWSRRDFKDIRWVLKYEDKGTSTQVTHVGVSGEFKVKMVGDVIDLYVREHEIYDFRNASNDILKEIGSGEIVMLEDFLHPGDFLWFKDQDENKCRIFSINKELFKLVDIEFMEKMCKLWEGILEEEEWMNEELKKNYERIINDIIIQEIIE